MTSVEDHLRPLREDVDGITSFISGELLKLAQANLGKINIEDMDFRTMTHSLMNADPEAPNNIGKPVLSFKGTEQGIEKKLKKFQSQGKETEKFRKELAQKRSKLEFKLASREGITELIGQKYRKDSIGKSIQLIDGKTKDFLTYEPRKRISDELERSGPIFSQATTHMMLTSPSFREYIDKEYKTQINKHFSLEGKTKSDGLPSTFDASKLTENQVKKFSSRMELITSSATITALSAKPNLTTEEQKMLLDEAGKLSKHPDRSVRLKVLKDLKTASKDLKIGQYSPSYKDLKKDLTKTTSLSASITNGIISALKTAKPFISAAYNSSTFIKTARGKSSMSK